MASPPHPPTGYPPSDPFGVASSATLHSRESSPAAASPPPESIIPLPRSNSDWRLQTYQKLWIDIQNYHDNFGKQLKDLSVPPFTLPSWQYLQDRPDEELLDCIDQACIHQGRILLQLPLILRRLSNTEGSVTFDEGAACSDDEYEADLSSHEDGQLDERSWAGENPPRIIFGRGLPPPLLYRHHSPTSPSARAFEHNTLPSIHTASHFEIEPTANNASPVPHNARFGPLSGPLAHIILNGPAPREAAHEFDSVPLDSSHGPTTAGGTPLGRIPLLLPAPHPPQADPVLHAPRPTHPLPSFVRPTSTTDRGRGISPPLIGASGLLGYPAQSRFDGYSSRSGPPAFWEDGGDSSRFPSPPTRRPLGHYSSLPADHAASGGMNGTVSQHGTPSQEASTSQNGMVLQVQQGKRNREWDESEDFGEADPRSPKRHAAGWRQMEGNPHAAARGGNWLRPGSSMRERLQKRGLTPPLFPPLGYAYREVSVPPDDASEGPAGFSHGRGRSYASPSGHSIGNGVPSQPASRLEPSQLLRSRLDDEPSERRAPSAPIKSPSRLGPSQARTSPLESEITALSPAPKVQPEPKPTSPPGGRTREDESEPQAGPSAGLRRSARQASLAVKDGLTLMKNKIKPKKK